MIVILNYGMGVDSTSILARWLTEPATRDFDLADLIVVTAQTGDEFPDTRLAVETHILPLLRERGIRYVQLARRGPLVEDGIVVLDDSRTPAQLRVEVAYKLSEEMLAT